MQTSSLIRTLQRVAAMAALVGGASAAQAGGVYWAVNVDAPSHGGGRIGTTISNSHWGMRGPAPVVVLPQPVYQPVYQVGYPAHRPSHDHAHGHHHHHHHGGWGARHHSPRSYHHGYREGYRDGRDDDRGHRHGRRHGGWHDHD